MDGQSLFHPDPSHDRGEDTRALAVMSHEPAMQRRSRLNSAATIVPKVTHRRT